MRSPLFPPQALRVSTPLTRRGTTAVNGVNDRGDLVGCYLDGSGHADGFVAIA